MSLIHLYILVDTVIANSNAISGIRSKIHVTCAYLYWYDTWMSIIEIGVYYKHERHEGIAG
jgi:hypothetical protein